MWVSGFRFGFANFGMRTATGFSLVVNIHLSLCCVFWRVLREKHQQMGLKAEIDELRTQNGGTFVDENVYCALVLAVVAKKHVLIASKDTNVAEHEVGVVLNQFWKFEAEVFRVRDCQKGSHLVELRKFFTRSKTGRMGLMFVINGVEKLEKDAQLLLKEIVRTRRATDETGREVIAGEVFGIVGISTEKKPQSLPQPLRDAFWFKQPYTPTYELHDNIDMFTPGIFQPTGKTTDRLRKILAMGNNIKSITIVPELKRYIYDVVVFVRNHRCVSTGLPTKTINDLELLCRALCVVLEKEYVIPTIAKLAMRKLLPLKLVMIRPELEPSLLWGSDPELVKELMKRVTPVIIVENCLTKVMPPL